MVTDTLIHLQDIRRPLGMGSDIDPNSLVVMLEFLTTNENAEMAGDALARTRGLHLVANDLDWSTGDGPTVEGPGEALAMASAGRGSALEDLGADGLSVMRSRTSS